MPSSYQVVLWKQESFVVLRPLHIEFFRNLLGAGELRGTDDSATPSASGHRGAVISAGDIRNVPRFDRIRASRSAGTLSNTGVADIYISRGRILLTGYPIGGQRRDGVGRIVVDAGRSERHLSVPIGLRVRGCGVNRDGLELTLTLTGAAGQRKRCGQNQSEKRKHEPKLFHNLS